MSNFRIPSYVKQKCGIKDFNMELKVKLHFFFLPDSFVLHLIYNNISRPEGNEGFVFQIFQNKTNAIQDSLSWPPSPKDLSTET